MSRLAFPYKVFKNSCSRSVHYASHQETSGSISILTRYHYVKNKRVTVIEKNVPRGLLGQLTTSLYSRFEGFLRR